MLFILSLITACWASSPVAKIVIRQVQIADGTGGPKTGPLDVEITGERITRIAPNIKSAKAQEIEGRGRVLVPGLIDAHVHLASIPGAEFHDYDEAKIQALQRQGLRAYLAAGVTTVLDCAAPEWLVREAAELERDNPAPRILTLAPFLTPKGGYFAEPNMRGYLYRDLWPPIENSAQVAEEMSRGASLKAFGAKVTMESGFLPFDSWPIFNKEMRQVIKNEAAKNHLPLFVHSQTAREHRLALELKPYALVHAGFFENAPDPEILRELKDSGAYIITTSAIERIIGMMWEKDLAEDPYFRSLVPSAELRDADDLRLRGRVVAGVAMASAPWWVPGLLVRMFAPTFFNQKVIGKMSERSKSSLLTLYRNGLPLVMGSDAGNWPLWTTFFHGPSSIIEMENLMEAGIPAYEVLAMATSRAAKMLKIDDQVGQVKVGKMADLLLLRRDPRAYRQAYRDIEWVIKGGQARPPADWRERPSIH